MYTAAALGCFAACTPSTPPPSPLDCHHPPESAAFAVAGACGPDARLTVASAADSCALSVAGGDGAFLPDAGAFLTTTALDAGGWALSGVVFLFDDVDAGFDGGATVEKRNCIASPQPGGVLSLACNAADPETRCEDTLTPFDGGAGP